MAAEVFVTEAAAAVATLKAAAAAMASSVRGNLPPTFMSSRFFSAASRVSRCRAAHWFFSASRLSATLEPRPGTGPMTGARVRGLRGDGLRGDRGLRGALKASTWGICNNNIIMIRTRRAGKLYKAR